MRSVAVSNAQSFEETRGRAQNSKRAGSTQLLGRMSASCAGTLFLTVFLPALVSSGNADMSLGPDMQFVQNPGNVTSSLGKPVVLRCVLQGGGFEIDPPDIVWQKDAEPLDLTDTNQMQEVQLSDMGVYRCVVTVGGQETVSLEGSIQLEGLPHFSVEPQDMSVEANTSLKLECVAHGPPEPVRVIWLQDGRLNRTSTFSCEAHNRKGVATSASGIVTVTNSSLRVSWQPSFGGAYPVTVCSIQATPSDVDLSLVPVHLIHNQNINVPPSTHLISNLEPFSSYRVRVACRSSQGASSWTPWVLLQTAEGVPTDPPMNITAILNGTEMLVSWARPTGRLNGHLVGYRLEYSTPNVEQAVLDAGLNTDLSINLSLPLSNVSLRVCAYTEAGPGPWSPIHTLTLIQPGHSSPKAFSWHWWYVVMAMSVAVALAVLIAVYAARLRRKETRFGEAFEPMMESGELVVRYRARRSYSRRTNEATCLLTHDESQSALKVAVKTMKIAICTRSEMEDFLREAACMKEFDHTNGGGHVTTAEVHPPGRYVICPQHEPQPPQPRVLNDSLESLHLTGSSSSTPTLLLQPSSCSTPLPSPLGLGEGPEDLGEGPYKRVFW
ncbi:hypothetical protein JZ751_002103 [Albula glossodonta]|uniref:Uncharacterized protein n=1 Tax=Albula glossodonta TaxID=121402 RepID=A0A8T2PFV2_9TELE|nr:hypothetical protein JZ751_002103 [Albula glossodonta]